MKRGKEGWDEEKRKERGGYTNDEFLDGLEVLFVERGDSQLLSQQFNQSIHVIFQKFRTRAKAIDEKKTNNQKNK